MICILLSYLFIILNLIELSSQSKHSSDGADHLCRSQSNAELTVRARSRSPTLRRTFPIILGFRFEDLELIRLRPFINPNQVFELRKYVFPPDQQISLRTKSKVLTPLPTGEQIVLSTSDGDVCAILQKSSSRHTILRGMFKPAPGRSKRVRINMNSGEVKDMTEEEEAECRVSVHENVAMSYGVSCLSSHFKGPPDDDLHLDTNRCEPSCPPPTSSQPPAEPSTRVSSRSSTLRETFPSLLGFKYDDFDSIRLSPHSYPNRIFELQTYVFPLDKPIGLRTKRGVLNPMPTGDQIVLSAFDGDVCAILMKSSSKTTCLRPILTSILGIFERVKINMNSGVVKILTADEITECPATSGDAITKFYRVFRV